jgi:3,4-dihydroxy 2-butanone 4-phosphate synthase
MNQHSVRSSSDPFNEVEEALAALRAGRGLLVVDDENRENEGDLVFPAQTLTESQMAMLIRECSGIVCLCLTGEKADALGLPMMVEKNTNHHQTAFTQSIEAACGVTTGVSAQDRLATVRAAVARNARPQDLCRPGHVFPLRARPGGVLERPGHTEAVVDLARLAGFDPCGVLCELTNADGSMSRMPEIRTFSERHSIPILKIESLIAYRAAKETAWDDGRDNRGSSKQNRCSGGSEAERGCAL